MTDTLTQKFFLPTTKITCIRTITVIIGYCVRLNFKIETRPGEAVKLHQTFVNFKFCLCVNKKNIWGKYPLFFKPTT